MLEEIAQQVDEAILISLGRLRSFLPIDASSRQSLLNICRQELNSYLNIPSSRSFDQLTKFIIEHNAILFVSILLENRVLSCVFSPAENLADSCRRAIKKALKSVSIEHGDQLYIEICLLLPDKIINVNEFDSYFIKGFHAVSLQSEEKTVFFKNSVAVRHALTNDALLERLSRKLSRKIEKNEILSVGLYRTVEFREDFFTNDNRYGLLDLFRCSPILLQSEITESFLSLALENAQQYIINHICERGVLTYEYKVLTGERKSVSGRSAIIREMASLWSFLESAKYNSKAFSRRLIVKARNFLTENLDPNDINMRAFSLLLDNSLGLVTREKESYSDLKNTEFYLKASLIDKLVYLNALNVDDKISEVFLINEFYQINYQYDENMIFNAIAWYSKCAAKLYWLTKDNIFVSYLTKINNFVMAKQIKGNYVLIDAVGGFDPDNHSRITASCLESLVEAFFVIQDVGDEVYCNQLVQSIMMACRALLQNQYLLESGFSFLAMGGVRNSAIDHVIRIDNVQHAIFAVLGVKKVLQNYTPKIVEDSHVTSAPPFEV